jgi:hypothetical protein
MSSLEQSINFLKSGDIQAARDCLGIISEIVPDELLLQGLMAFDRAISNLQRNELVDARKNLGDAACVIEVCNDTKARMLISLLTSQVEGQFKLLSGDAHGAAEHFESTANAVEALSFFSTELQQQVHLLRGVSFLALARASLNAGDQSGAETWAGKADDQYQRLKQLVALQDPKDAFLVIQIHNQRLEFATTFALIDFGVLDFEMAKRRIDSVSSDRTELERVLQALTQDPLRYQLEAVLALHVACSGIVTLGRSLILGQRITRDDLTALEELEQCLFLGYEAARKAGESSIGLRRAISRLDRMKNGLMRVAQSTTKEQRGRQGGRVSFACFVVLVLLGYLTGWTAGWFGAWFVLASLIMSLIAGFGFSSLRFRPFLQLLAVRLGKGESVDKDD